MFKRHKESGTDPIIVKPEEHILQCKILVVEDDLAGRTMLVHTLRKHGFQHIEEAVDGKDGLDKIISFRPDMIIVDIKMPKLDGFEFCRLVRSYSDPVVSHIPILVQTGLTRSSEKADIFAAGASDYVSKPVDPTELVARCIVHLERELMTRELRAFRERVRIELDTAQSTQRVLIPDKESIDKMEKTYNIRALSHFQSCTELGGDFWGIEPLSTEEFALFTVDFSGHGVNAALNVFRLHALMRGALSIATTPGAYLTHLSAILSSMLPTGQFATMFYGVVNTNKNTLSYAAAASPSPVLFKGDGTHKILDTSGTLLGISKKNIYHTKEVSFESGDCLLLYSDAMLETGDSSGKSWDTEQIIGAFYAGMPASRHYDQGFNWMLDYFKKNFLPNLSDDLTLVACFR